MIPLGLEALMTLSLPIGRRATKCLVPGASAIYLFNEGSGTVLRDYSGNGHDGTLGADAAAPTWGATGLTFDGDAIVALGTPAGILDTDAPYTIFGVFYTESDVQQTLFAHPKGYGGTLGYGQYIFAESGAIRLVQYDDDGSRTRRSAGGVAAPKSAWNVFHAVYDGAALYVDINGTVGVATACGMSPAVAEPMAIGAYATGPPLGAIGTIPVLGIYPFALSRAQRDQNAQAVAAMLAHRGIALPPRYNTAIAIGDSLTLGVGIPGVTVTTTYPYDLQVLRGALVENAGIGGNTTAQMLARLPDLLDRISPPLVVILGGTNDVTDLVPATTIEANLAGMASASLAAGANVILATIPPSSLYSAAKNDILAAVNTWIATQAGQGIAVADTHAALKDPATPTQLLAAYDSGDHQHPNADALQVIANTVYATMQGVGWQ